MATVTGMTAEYLETRLADKVDNDALSELVDDRVSTLLVQGSGVTLDYDDTGNTLTISAEGGGGGTSFTVGGSTRADSALTVNSLTMGGQPVRQILATSTTFTDLSRGGVAGPEFTASSSTPGDFSPNVSGWYMVRVHAGLQWPAGGPDGVHWLIVTSNDNYDIVRPTSNDHPAYYGGETKVYRDEFFIGPVYIEDGTDYDQQFSWHILVPGTVSPSYVGDGAVYFDFVQVFPTSGSSGSEPPRGVTRAQPTATTALGGVLMFKDWTFDSSFSGSTELEANAPELELDSAGYTFRPTLSGFYMVHLWMEVHATTDLGNILVEWLQGSSSLTGALWQSNSVSAYPAGSNVYKLGVSIGPIFINGGDDPGDYWPLNLQIRNSPTSVTPATTSWTVRMDVWKV